MSANAEAAKGTQTEERPAGQPGTGQQAQPPAEGKVNLQPGAIPVDLAPPAAGTTPPEGGQPAQPPEGYELAVPQGFEIDQKGMEAFKAAAAKLKLPKEGAQELFDMFHARLQESAKQGQERLSKRMEELYEADRKVIDADPDYGGRNFKRSQEMVARALVRFCGERDEKGQFEFVNEMKDRGMANSPRLFRFLARVGEFLSEAGPAASDSHGSPAGRAPQEVLFEGYGQA